MHFDLFVPGAPKTKDRPRFNRKTGSAYTPKATLDEEMRIADAYMAAGGPVFGGPMALELAYYTDGTLIKIMERGEPSSDMRGDLDNYAKLTLDALQGAAFANDRKVHRIEAVMRGGIFL